MSPGSSRPAIPVPIKRLAAVSAVALGLLAVVAIVPNITSDRVTADDFVQDWLSARALTDGADPYDPLDELFERYLPGEMHAGGLVQHVNPHPPALVSVFRPLGGLTIRTARAIWLGLTAILYVASAFMFARSLGGSRATASVVGIGILAIPVVQKDLLWGQSNALLLFALVLGWMALRADRRRAAGIALGIGASLKLFPLLILIPLLRSGNRRAAGWLLVAFAAASAAGFMVTGWSAGARFLTEVTGSNATHWGPAPMNLSLVAVPVRWLTDNAWYPGVDLQMLARFIAATLFVVVVGAAVRTGGGISGDPYWAAVPLMLLASPLSWEFSLTLMLPAGMIIVSRAVDLRRPPHPVLMVSLLLIALGVPPWLPLPDQAGVLAQVMGYSLATYALIAIAASDALGAAPRYSS